MKPPAKFHKNIGKKIITWYTNEEIGENIITVFLIKGKAKTFRYYDYWIDNIR